MSISRTLALTWTRGSDQITKNVTITTDGGADRDIDLTSSQTNKQVALVIDVSEIKLLYILSDHDATLKTNSTSSPGNTIALTANKPLVWYVGCGMACPLTVDITTLYVTNGAAATALVKIRSLIDT